MKIKILSDLHLEFNDYPHSLEGADVLVLAGDIGVKNQAVTWLLGLNLKCPVVYVFGNHEFYKGSYYRTYRKAREMVQGSNIHILEKQFLDIDGVRFHGTTLWTDFDLYGTAHLSKMLAIEMNDYKKAIRIEPKYRKLNPNDTLSMFLENKRWLAQSLSESDAKTNVVVTHHAPSELSVEEAYKGSMLSPAYASRLENFILEHSPNLWAHGHTHSFADYMIGDTRVVANPRGYSDREVDEFDPGLIIEI